MNNQASPDRLTNRSHRPVYLISILLIVVVFLRRRYDLDGIFTFELMLASCGLFALLFLTEPLISRRVNSYPLIYFSIQFLIIQFLGVFKSYQDTWALLYIILGFQAAKRCPRKAALAWFGLFSASLLVTLTLEFGLISGLGRTMAYVVIGVLLISYDIQYAQHEDALAESQMLVAELQEAHQKLEQHSAQAEELATMQQRSRMLQELYDAVGQKIFAIQLATETSRLVLEKDPQRAAEQIENLQGQTQAALNQMRQLIEQWRPG